LVLTLSWVAGEKLLIAVRVVCWICLGLGAIQALHIGKKQRPDAVTLHRQREGNHIKVFIRLLIVDPKF
jgi:hypothetical protein